MWWLEGRASRVSVYPVALRGELAERPSEVVVEGGAVGPSADPSRRRGRPPEGASFVGERVGGG